MNRDAERPLLSGLLALQAGLIDGDQLAAAFDTWSREPDRSLVEVLAEQGALDGEGRSLLSTMSERHHARNGDAEAARPSIPVDPSTLQMLGEPADGDQTAPLAHIHDEPLASESSIGTAPGDGRRFRVLRPHARGGLGAVYVALDAELNREVALKQILDHHADDPVSRARFVVEAEITGNLEHPGIVPVYGLGRHVGGRPYYAMRFIRGDSLREAIASFHEDLALKAEPGRRSLALRNLLRRFVDVCNAIDYAHGRGVIHRDLKPANVIVGRHGETLVVDWGLAKALGVERGPDLVDGERAVVLSSASGSAETLPGQAIGTPAYMSPEQAAGDLDRLGPRSDVYSLGATLYSVLTGRTPFEGSQVLALLRRVREGDFPAPRRVDPSVDRALEAVCLKAMANRPEGRYASARALAEDVERWMADEPVSAWREPLARRVRRWARRNRPLVTAASAAVLVALAGLGTVAAVQRRANDDLRRANDRVQARFELAREAIRSFEDGVNQEDLLKERRFKPFRDKLLGSARRFYEKLEALLQEQPDGASRAILAESYLELGKLIDRIGRKPEALAACTKAVAIRRALASSRWAGAPARFELAGALVEQGRLLAAVGDPKGALAAFGEARALATSPAAGRGSLSRGTEVAATAHFEESNVLVDTGRLVEALAARRDALRLRQAVVDRRPEDARARADLAESHDYLGILLAKLGRAEEADAAYLKAQAIRRGLVRDEPDNTRFRADLAESHHNIAMQRAGTGRIEDALADYREARTIREALARENPALTSARRDLGHTLNNIGNLMIRLGRFEEGLALHRETLELRESLNRDDPTVVESRSELAQTLSNLGGALTELARPDESIAVYRRALDLKRALAAEQPANPEFRRELAGYMFNIANVYQDLGRRDEALAMHAESLAMTAALARDHPSAPAYRMEQAESLNKVGGLLSTSGRTREATASHREALEILRRLVREDPSDAGSRSELARSLAMLGVRRARDGHPDEGFDLLEQALAEHRELAGSGPKVPATIDEMAGTQVDAGDALRDLGRADEAGGRYAEALDALRSLAASNPTVDGYRTRQSGIVRRLALLRLAAGDRSGAARAAGEAVAIRQRDRPHNGSDWFELACDRATLAASGGGDGPTLEADRAIGHLREALADGYRDLDAFRHEPALGPLRARDDFRLLMLDLALPADPFARGG